MITGETIFIFRDLEDITLRAIKTLAAVDQILAEDTRRVSKLLHHYKIKTPKTPFHEYLVTFPGPKQAEILKTTFVAKDLAENIPDANIAIARELTKIHEEVWRGTPKKLLHLLSDKKIKGEITLVIQVST